MECKTAILQGKLMDVITVDEYSRKWRMYADNPSMCVSTALELNEGDKTLYLPFRGKSSDLPGIYPDGAVYFVKAPTPEEESDYAEGSVAVVDYSDTHNVKDFLGKNKQIRDMEAVVLTDIDSVFTPPAQPDDSPEMKVFKKAITAKHIDLSKYADRFGDNYLNDKRILKSGSITLNKLVSICEKLDIEAELTLRDAKSGDVANPMKTSFSQILTSEFGEEGEES